MWAEPPFVLGGGWVGRCSPGHVCLGRRLPWPRRMVWQHADSDAAAGDGRRSRRGVAGQVTMTVTAPVPLATLEATLERVTYANEDNGYTVAKVDPGRGGDLVTVVGSLLGAQPGEALRLRGRWSAHPQYGRQFHVEDYTTVLPATVQGILRYLGSGLIKGIGPKLAKKIVDHFGVASLDVIETTPQRLIEVPNLGPKRTRLITAAWQEQKTIKEVMVFLQGVGRVHVAGGPDLQAVRRWVDRRGPHRAVPAGERRVGDRVQNRGHHRAGGGRSARQPAAGEGRPAVHPVRGHGPGLRSGQPRPRPRPTRPARTTGTPTVAPGRCRIASWPESRSTAPPGSGASPRPWPGHRCPSARYGRAGSRRRSAPAPPAAPARGCASRACDARRASGCPRTPRRAPPRTGCPGRGSRPPRRPARRRRPIAAAGRPPTPSRCSRGTTPPSSRRTGTRRTGRGRGRRRHPGHGPGLPRPRPGATGPWPPHHQPAGRRPIRPAPSRAPRRAPPAAAAAGRESRPRCGRRSWGRGSRTGRPW